MAGCHSVTYPSLFSRRAQLTSLYSKGLKAEMGYKAAKGGEGCKAFWCLYKQRMGSAHCGIPTGW